MTGEVRAWEPGRRIVFGAAETPPEGAPDYAFEFLVEGRDGGGTVLRFVQSGFLDEGWEDEYSSLDNGWDLFFGNLRSYLAHFAGQPVHNVVTMAFTDRLGRRTRGRCCTARSGWPGGPRSARP